MTTDCTRLRRDPERGSAIIAVLLLLMLMTGLAAALSVSGRTEALVTRNHQSRAQARAAAEAGLNHAVQIAVDYLQTIDPVNIPGTLDALLNDTTPLAGVAFATPTGVAGALDTTVSYQILLMDEDDPARGAAIVAALVGNVAVGEDGSALTDSNNTLVFRATGIAQGGASVTLEALIAPVELGAIVTDGDLTISGNVTVSGGDDADVHSNGDMTMAGGSASVDGDVTATGAYDGPSGGGSGGHPEKPLPKISAEDYKHHADFILTSNGTLTNAAGTVLCTASDSSSCNSWVWSAGSLTWTINSNSATNGTYYVEGSATVAGSPGSASTPWAVTIIAEGSIDISGSPALTADTNELLFVTDGDLEISGGTTTSIQAQGQMLVHEQISISGNVTLGGQLIVEDSPSIDPTVGSNSISGSVVINYNGTLGTNLFFVTGWREVR